jgi:hypothetical protein
MQDQDQTRPLDGAMDPRPLDPPNRIGEGHQQYANHDTYSQYTFALLLQPLQVGNAH